MEQARNDGVVWKCPRCGFPLTEAEVDDRPFYCCMVCENAFSEEDVWEEWHPDDDD